MAQAVCQYGLPAASQGHIKAGQASARCGTDSANEPALLHRVVVDKMLHKCAQLCSAEHLNMHDALWRKGPGAWQPESTHAAAGSQIQQ